MTKKSPVAPQSVQSSRASDENSYIRFLVLGIIVLGVISVVARLSAELSPFPALLLGINGAALFLCGFDKSLASAAKTRVPEKVLLLFGLLGGSLGLVTGMFFFRHKTKKSSFIFGLLIILVIHILLLQETGFVEALKGVAIHPRV